MDEELSDSSSPLLLYDNHIRSVQINLQAQLESFHNIEPDANIIETYSVCENIRDKVLNCEDESHLSKIHNNSRRISIASELFISICSVYGYIVDCEFTKIIDNLLQWKKFQYISKKITHKMQLELKKEKYFLKEAQSLLQKSLEDGNHEVVEDLREIVRPVKGTGIVAKDSARHEKSHVKEKEHGTVEAAEEGTLSDEINKILGLTAEHSTRDEISNVIGDITAIRAESPTDISMLQIPHLGRETNSLPAAVPEIPIQETSIQENAEDDITKILEILEGEKEVDEMEVPESLLETTAMAREPTEEPLITEESLSEDVDVRMGQSKKTDEWDLPKLKPVKKSKKKHYPVIIDKTITIHNYSERALYLNSNIDIQRVQVFEGPPEVLQAMSASYLMKTPGFKSSLFQDVRSSRLSRLFERHLKVEKKPVEHITVPEMRTVEEFREIGISKAHRDVVEDVGVREGLYSLPGKGDVLVEAAGEKSHLEDIEIPTTGVLHKESLVGMPLSRIVSTSTALPDIEKINNISVSLSPRARQMQGKSLDPQTRSSWFHSTRENPPSAKYKEFNYVYKKVQDYWSLFESQGLEKSITLREFFHLEEDGSVANFLTVLRVVDKLSMRRKLLLKYQNQDVFIRPFEYPFVTEKQLLLKDKEPIL